MVLDLPLPEVCMCFYVLCFLIITVKRQRARLAEVLPHLRLPGRAECAGPKSMFWLVRIGLGHFLGIDQVQLERPRLPFAQGDILCPIGKNAFP